MSETDKADGITVNSNYRRVRVEKTNTETFANVVFYGSEADLIKVGSKSVAKLPGATVTYQMLNGKDVIAEGDWSETMASVPLNQDMTVVISLFYDVKGVDGANGPDKTDDRLQKTYTVHLETAVDSGLYSIAGSYTVNNTDDLEKLVKAGEYTGLYGLYDEEYDAANDQVYVYQYRIDGDDIWADWVKEGSALFAKSTTNDKDTNGDGKVSCDEYYGTTGLEWSDKLNACVVSSTGDAVVTIPNTATK